MSSPKWTGILPPWYYATRVAGLALLGFGAFVDHSPERGTLIITGAGLLGIDKVARSETPKKSE